MRKEITSKSFFLNAVASVARLRADRTGSIGIIFALSAVPLIAAAGAAVNFTAYNLKRSELQAAADSASLAAVGISSSAMKAATTGVDDPKDPGDQGNVHTGAASAKARFLMLAKNTGLDVSGVTVTINKTGQTLSARIDYQAVAPTQFGSLFGLPSANLRGSATAANALAPFIDFYMLLDNTPSMGVAATSDGVNRMVANTTDQCAFACHITGSNNDYYALAKSLGVKMRIDVVQQATQSLMDTAARTAASPQQYRFGLYTFGADAQTRKFTQLLAPTSDLAQVKQAAGKVDLMTIPYQGYDNDQMTDFNAILPQANAVIPAPGDGSSPAQPQKILFFVTDGMGDSQNPRACLENTLSGGRCQEEINVARCNEIKARGVKIALLYTTYLPLPTNPWYVSTVQPWASKIAPAAQACASPGLYFEVSPSQGIAEAMSALFMKTVQLAKLRQ
ncbi:MAG: VWA domain-containing protein [Hyphomicrobiales bacterium]|nr:VWA domain-containing protein [Hyphomicrobiales bacterium]